MKYIIGTRGSRLSLAQTNTVISQLKKINNACDYEVKIIKTRGDVDHKPIFMLDQKGVFEKEIDKAVLNNEVDFAIHSLKDIPTSLTSELVISSIPKRESINDVFISHDCCKLNNVKKNAIIGTSSLRRAIQIKRLRSDIIVKPLRGNIELRIEKLNQKSYDGIVIAEAGLIRTSSKTRFLKLSLSYFPPSPGQGALGIVCRKDNKNVIYNLKKIEYSDSRLEIEAERALSVLIESGCKFPVGSYAKVNKQNLKLVAVAYSIDGTQIIKAEKTMKKNNIADVSKFVYEDLCRQGIKKFVYDWREKLEKWNT